MDPGSPPGPPACPLKFSGSSQLHVYGAMKETLAMAQREVLLQACPRGGLAVLVLRLASAGRCRYGVGAGLP